MTPRNAETRRGLTAQTLAPQKKATQVDEYDIGRSSSISAHFRAVTAMTPLQFQKQLRLQDARNLMLVEQIDVVQDQHLPVENGFIDEYHD